VRAMEIAAHDIARWRLRSQGLVRPHVETTLDAVGNLLAVQAENPGQSAWAVASRTLEPSQREVTSALEDGRLIRTHVLRPTWHYVRAEDIGWLLELTAPRVRRTTEAQLRGPHGFDDRGLDRATAKVVEILEEEPDRTRGRLAEGLRDRGVETDGQSLMILLAHLELDRIVCSGRPVGEDHTYALFAERVQSPRRLDRDEALGELALRYFTGHGPATERDLAYWATLTLTDVRRGFSVVGERLASFEYDGRTFWHAPGDLPRRRGEPAGHLLQILDEMYRGYQDTRWVLDAEGIVPRARESAIGMALVDAQLLAAMKRTVTAGGVAFRLNPHRPMRPRELTALRRAAERYGDYLGLAATLEVA
jgi:Winged helix DNA-binding domain